MVFDDGGGLGAQVKYGVAGTQRAFLKGSWPSILAFLPRHYCYCYRGALSVLKFII